MCAVLANVAYRHGLDMPVLLLPSKARGISVQYLQGSELTKVTLTPNSTAHCSFSFRDCNTCPDLALGEAEKLNS